jgi:hypothetical protein
MGMSDDKDRYWPRSFSLEPFERDPVTILNEPPLPDNVSVMVPKALCYQYPTHK